MHGRSRFFALLIIACVCISNVHCAAIYRHQKRTINENYREGIQLVKQGRYKEAVERFKKVQSIDPDHTGSRQYLIIATEAMQTRAKKFYDAGISFKRKGDYDNALTQFLEAEKRDPEYKDIKQQITAIRNSNYAVKKYNTYFSAAQKQFDKKRYINAYRMSKRAEFYDPGSLELKAIQARIKNRLDNASYPLTEKAEEAKKKNRIASARTYSARALKINPWDEKARSILNDINRLQNLNTVYNNAEKAMRSGDLITAYRLFNRIETQEPGYRNTKSHIENIRPKLEAHINTFYHNGISHYEQDNFASAISEWDKVLLINPDHQKARDYRERAVAKLELQKSLQQN